jgi:alpha-tubulin suppressor-like RCC1 family protein
VSGDLTFTSLSAGGSLTCGLATDGSAHCWGWNGEGQLGNGDTDDRSSPTPVSGGLTVSEISVGNFHVCAVSTANELYCWGRNETGQIGDGTVLGSSIPIATGSGMAFESVSVGSGHTCGISLSEAYCWGYAEYGQTGNGGANKDVPTLLNGTIQFAVLYAGGNYTCGLTGAGEAHCWGINNLGQHGSLSTQICSVLDETGQIIDQFACAFEPALVETQVRFSSLSLGQHHSCGISTDNLAYCWGGGLTGELGDGRSGNTYTRVALELVSGQPGA